MESRVHTGRTFMANRPDMIIQTKTINNNGITNTSRQESQPYRNRKEAKIREFMFRDTTNVRNEMYDHIGNNRSHWNSNGKLREKFGNCTRKTFDRFTTKDSYTWDITHNTESTAV